MKNLHPGLIGLGVAVFIAFAASVAYGGGHPTEHPSEHPSKSKVVRISTDNLADAIAKYIDEDSKLKGGYFMVFDSKSKAPLLLTLDKVHKERLSQTAPETYFACADFKTPEGKVYDLDIFMKGKSATDLDVTEVSIHKESGKARYTWFEKGGMWGKKTVK